MSGKKEVKRERVEYLEDLLSFRRDIKTELSCLGRGGGVRQSQFGGMGRERILER